MYNYEEFLIEKKSKLKKRKDLNDTSLDDTTTLINGKSFNKKINKTAYNISTNNEEVRD